MKGEQGDGEVWRWDVRSDWKGMGRKEKCRKVERGLKKKVRKMEEQVIGRWKGDGSVGQEDGKGMEEYVGR